MVLFGHSDLFRHLLPNALGDDSRKLLVSDTAGDFYRSILSFLGVGLSVADGKSRNIDTGRTRQDDSLSV